MYNDLLLNALQICEDAIISVLSLFRDFLNKMPFLATLIISSFAFVLSARFIFKPIFGAAGSDVARGMRSRRGGSKDNGGD